MKDKNTNIVKDIDKFSQKIFEEYKSLAEKTKDSILLVLRVHLRTEQLLENFIALKLPRADRILYKANLTYFHKLLLADSFDILPNEVIEALKNLNALRNSCAHKSEKIITEDEIDKMGRPFGKQYTKIKRNLEGKMSELLLHVLAIIFGTLAGYVFGHERKTES